MSGDVVLTVSHHTVYRYSTLVETAQHLATIRRSRVRGSA